MPRPLRKRLLLADWEKTIFQLTDVKVILYLKQKGLPVRYSELLQKVAGSRGSLATSLSDLQKLGLLNRKVKTTRPVQTEYTLTENGNRIAQLLTQINQVIQI